MNSKPIGIFDSGVGGLTSAKQFLAIMPNENVIFLGDTRRNPYGTKTKDTLMQYAIDDVDFLQRRDVKLIIVACGTISSNVPAARLKNLKVPYVDVITPTVNKVVKTTKTKRVGIIGTPATIKSGSFANRLKRLDKEIETMSVGCPMMVTLAENGDIDENNFVANSVIKEYLAPIKAFGADTLILGCTHFPLMSKIIQKVMGDEVTLIDSGYEAAIEAKKILEQKDMCREGERDLLEFNVTGNTEKFDEVANIFLEGKYDVHSKKADIYD